MQEPRTVIFLGTSSFAIPSLEVLFGNPSFRITHIITQPDKPVGRKQLITPPLVKTAALEHHLPVLQPENLNREFSELQEREQIERPDFLIVVSYGQILTKDILNFPTIAPINVHASLLPQWRGASPIQQAILSGQRETGVTVQKMARELDAGPILSQQAVPLTDETTTTALHDELARNGAELLIETLLLPLEPIEQDHTKATVCKKLKREDGIVNPEHMTAEEIHRKVRALVPWPGVTLSVNNQPMKLLRTSLIETKDSAPLSCKDGSILYLEEVQMPGKKAVSGKMWEAQKR